MHTVGGANLLINSGADFGHLGEDLNAVCGFTAHVGKRLKGAVVIALLHQPSWRFVEKEEADQHESAWDDLNCNRDSPLLRRRFDVERDAVVEPVGDHDTEDDELLEQTRDTATHVGGRVFCDKDGGDTCHATDANWYRSSSAMIHHTRSRLLTSSNDTSTVDLANVVMSTSLYGSTYQEDDSVEDKGSLASEAVIQKGGEDGAEEGTGSQQTDDVGRDVSVLRAGESGLVNRETIILLEAGQGQDTSHDTGIITEEESAHIGDGGEQVDPAVLEHGA